MIVSRDNMSAPSSRDRAQRLFDKNVELETKRRRSAQARVPSDPNAWQQMRENYEAIILEDHSFSEQHGIEYALWQLHYRRIEEFRAHFNAASASLNSTTSQTGKNPNRVAKIRLQFKTFLSEATGFYHDLILKVRSKYGLPIGHFSELTDSQVVTEKDGKKSVEMKKGLVSCHRCLIYLGDLARYKGLYGEGDSKSRDYAAASSYYLQAASLWPSSGNPHHQLAILATYSGDELLTVYHYFRSLAADIPFSTAKDNLIVVFEKNRQNYSQFHGDAKATKESASRMAVNGRGKGEAKLGLKDGISSAKEKAASYKAFCLRFVRLNGILFTRTSLEMFGEVLSLVSSSLQENLSSGTEEEPVFGTEAVDNGLLIVRLISILIFIVHNVKKEAEGQSYADIVQRAVLLQNALIAVFELMGQIVKRCEKLSDPSSSYLLHGILIFVEWLASCADVAAGNDRDEKQVSVRSIFWHNFISLLNKISYIDNEEAENQVALWEDFELRGFLPLQPSQTGLDFSRRHPFGGDGKREKMVRAKRVLAAGKKLADIVKVDRKPWAFDLKLKIFGVDIRTDDIPPTLGRPESKVKPDEITKTPLVLPKEVPSTLFSAGSESKVKADEIRKKPLALPKQVPLKVKAEIITRTPPVLPKEVPPTLFSAKTESKVKAEEITKTPLVLPKEVPRTLFSANPESKVKSEEITKTPLVLPKEVPPTLFSANPESKVKAEEITKTPLVLPKEDLCLEGEEDDDDEVIVFKPTVIEKRNDAISVNDSKFYAGTASSSQGNLQTSSFVPVSQPHSSTWLADNQASLANGLRSLNFFENGIQQKINTSASFESSTMLQSSGVTSGLPASSVRGPATRPVRHLGPPPGFTSIRPKMSNEPISRPDLATHFDGYQFPPGFNQPISRPIHSNSLFPFPGKQAQLQQQQFIPMPDQFDGHGMRSGRHFV